MLKTLFAVLMGGVSLTAHASQLVRLDVDQKANSYAVYVEMELDAPAEKVRSILTDYAHLDRLNASIIASKILADKNEGTVRVLTRFESLECLTRTDTLPYPAIQTAAVAEHRLNMAHSARVGERVNSLIETGEIS